MPESHAARGARRGRRQLLSLGEEIRGARLAAGLTLAEVATAVSMSGAELSRIERGLAPWVGLLTAYRVCAVVGLDLWMRTYPGGDPLRDAAHVRLQRQFLSRLGPGLQVRMEVPIGHARDLRAWDTVVTADADQAAVEFETRIIDAQALVRGVNLKRRDSGIERVILVLSDTALNRRAVAAARDTLRETFPLDPATLLRTLANGRLPARGGIVFLRATSEPDRLRGVDAPRKQ